MTRARLVKKSLRVQPSAAPKQATFSVILSPRLWGDDDAKATLTAAAAIHQQKREAAPKRIPQDALDFNLIMEVARCHHITTAATERRRFMRRVPLSRASP